MRIEEEPPKKTEIRNSKSEIGPPMPFSRNPLTASTRACFSAEKKNTKMKVINAGMGIEWGKHL